MINKLHYDVKFTELLAVQDIAGGNVDSGDCDVNVTNAERITILVSGVVAVGTTDQDHTFKVYKVKADGTGDVAIPFDISKITYNTGAYSAWTECTAAAGHVIAAAGVLTVGTHIYLIEVDKAQFIDNGVTAASVKADILNHLAFKVTGTNDTSTWTANATAILYGLNYQIED